MRGGVQGARALRVLSSHLSRYNNYLLHFLAFLRSPTCERQLEETREAKAELERKKKFSEVSPAAAAAAAGHLRDDLME